MDKRTSSKQSKASRDNTQDVSLAGLDFETAVRATLATGKAPPQPKRKPKGKK